MEQCLGTAGPVLLQRWTSTIGTAQELQPLFVAGNDTEPVQNLSLVLVNASSTAFGLRPLILFADNFVRLLPNITDYEANRKELGNALLLNISVFAIGFALFLICPCVGACWRSSSCEEARRPHGSSGGDEAGSDPGVADSHIDGGVAKQNYLLYLLVCMYACIALSFVNICFLLPHGLDGSVFFGGWSILMVLGQVSFAEMYVITVVDGCIVLAFSRLFDELIELPEKDSSMSELRRTVWLQGLPTHDTHRWWKPFRVNRLEEGRAKHDLMDALTDTLLASQHDTLQLPNTTTTSLSSQPLADDAGSSAPCPTALGQQGRLGSKTLRPAASLGRAATSLTALGIQRAPASLPPVDLQGTSWQCCLDGGNPYYLNTRTGAVQWELPAELAGNARGPVDSPVVDEVYVALVLDEWCRTHTDLRHAQEMLAAYEEKEDLCRQELAEPELSWLRRLFLEPRLWWYDTKVSSMKPTIEVLKTNLETIHSGKKHMSGSAFVTFKDPHYRDKLLQEEQDESLEDAVSTFVTSRSYTYFSFGRPPFASVTLTCERAPHPSDVNWENLHVVWWHRELVFWVLASLLLFAMVGLVTFVRISELVVPILMVAQEELHALEKMPAWNDYVPTQVKDFVYSMDNDDIWKSLLNQVPTMILLFINSVVVPAAVTGIAACERTVKLSDAERTRMLVNFFFLFMNTVVVPFCGVASLTELLEKLQKALKEKPDPEPFSGLIFASPGMFALKYIMNATFISSVNQLMQLPQRASRWCQLTFLAVTDRQKIDFQKPWEFFWGYWYAWTLSVFALGITMSVACPGTLLIGALFFFTKYNVDKYNLDNGIYACGTDVEGGLAVRVVCYIRVVVAMWWFAMGSLSYAIGVFDPHDNWTLDQRLWLRQGGVTLMVFGAVTCARSWWLRSQQLHRIGLQGPQRKRSEPNCWEQLGEFLFLKEPQRRSSGPPSSSATIVAERRQKNESQLLSWDGAKLLGLE